MDDYEERLEWFKSLPYEVRRKVYLVNNKGTKHNKPHKRFNDPDVLLQWARENDIVTQRQLLSKRKWGDPNVETFKKAFGSWRAFREALGKPFEEKPKPPVNMDYLANILIQFDVWKLEDYIKLRNRRPDIIPSMGMVNKLFGKWLNLKDYAIRKADSKLLEEYMKLRIKYGKWPTPTECKREKLNLARLVEIHGTKRRLDKFLERMIGMNDE